MNSDTAARQAPGDGAVDLAYEVAGQRGRPLLLLIHGGTSSRRSWDLLTPALRASFRIVAVDLRGHGHSPAPDRGYSALQLSADVGRLADELELQGVSVVGHSLGGMVAIHLAAHRPDVVRKLVLLNVPVTPRALEPLVRLEARVRDPGFFPLTEAFVDEWSSAARALPPHFLAAQQAHIRALRPVVWRQMFAELARADVSSELQQVRQSTLILWGARDGLLGEGPREQLQAGLGKARVVTISDAGHNPATATPGRVAEEISAFAADA